MRSYPTDLWRDIACRGLCLCVLCAGCTLHEPLVANSLEPWEAQVQQEQVVQRQQREAQLALREKRPSRTAPEGEKERSGIVTALADILAFPIRGAAWLAHTVL